MRTEAEREFDELMSADGDGITGCELASQWKARAALPTPDTAIGFRTLHRLKVDAGYVIDLLQLELDDARTGLDDLPRLVEQVKRLKARVNNHLEDMARATRYGNELIERNRHLESELDAARVENKELTDGKASYEQLFLNERANHTATKQLLDEVRNELDVLTIQSDELGTDLDATKTHLSEAMRDVERWKAAHTEVHDAWKQVCSDLASAKKEGAIALYTVAEMAEVDALGKAEVVEAFDRLHDRQAADAWAEFAQAAMDDDGAPPVPPCPDEVPTCPETGVEHDPEFERDLDERIVAVWYTQSSRGNATRPTLRTLGELGDPLKEMYGALFERGEPYHLIREETRGASAWLYREGFAPDTAPTDCIGCGRQLMTVRDRQGDELALDYQSGVGWRPHTCGWLKDPK